MGDTLNVAAILINAAHGEGSGHTKRRGIGSRDIADALGTITASDCGGHAVASAYLMQANGGFNTVPGNAASYSSHNHDYQYRKPATIGIRLSDSSIRREHRFEILPPMGTVMTDGGGGKTSLAVCELGTAEERALKVAAFMVNYYGNGDARDLTAPMDTLTTKDRLAL